MTDPLIFRRSRSLSVGVIIGVCLANSTLAAEVLAQSSTVAAPPTSAAPVIPSAPPSSTPAPVAASAPPATLQPAPPAIGVAAPVTGEPATAASATDPQTAPAAGPIPLVAAPEVAAVPEVEPTEPTFKITGAPGQGLTVSTGDAFSLNIKSRIQVKYSLNTFEDETKDAQQLVNIGTARIWLGGNVLVPKLTYQIQLAVAGRDYRDGTISPIFDAYLEWKAHRDFAVRAGQYFVPFDRLRTVREWGLQLTERPRPVQEFTLDRDVGVTFFSEKFLSDNSIVAWYLSAFGGRGTNQINPGQTGALLTGRLELRPLGPIDDDREGDLDRRTKPGLAIGGGFAQNFNTNRQRSTTGLTFAGGTTDDTYVAVDAVFKWFGFALEAEYLYKRSSEDSFDIENDDDTITTEYTRSGAGWILQASYAFDPPFEIVGRLSRIYAQSTLDPAFITEAHKRGNEVAAGLNYYFNAHRLKAQTTWVARTDADLAISRADHGFYAQIDATF